MISWASLGVSHVFLENIERSNEDRQDIVTVLPYSKYGKKIFWLSNNKLQKSKLKDR